MKFALLIVALSLSLSACQMVEKDPLAEYLALAPADHSVESNRKIQLFVNLYNKLKDKSLVDNIAKAYAEKLYFNDTVVTLHSRKELQKYLQHTQESLDSMSFEALEVYEKNNDVLVRWSMRTQFTIMGQQRDVKSLGISHLRFDNDGKIVLHQDYWDSTQGFYQHIPLIGGLLRWIKKGLQDY
jgi:ketosteroid isomerase-like protein